MPALCYFTGSSNVELQKEKGLLACGLLLRWSQQPGRSQAKSRNQREKRSDRPPLLCQVHQQGTGSEGETLGHKLLPIQDPDIAEGSFAHYDTILVPRDFLRFKKMY